MRAHCARSSRSWSLMPVAVVAGFEAAFYTPGARPLIAEFGRYAFPAIASAGACLSSAQPARVRPAAGCCMVGAGLLVAMIALSYASQLLTLTGSMPDVTVAIPVRDGGELLAGTLARARRRRPSSTSCSCATPARRDGSLELARDARRARARDRARALHPRRHAQPADGASAAARTWRCSPRTPSRPTSAGSSACSAGFELARGRRRSSTGPTARGRDAPPAVRIELERWFSLARRPTGRPQVERLAGPSAPRCPWSS